VVFRTYPGRNQGIPYLPIEATAKPDFTVILNEVKDLKSIKIRDSSLRSE
jgi:hypothetical protein